MATTKTVIKSPVKKMISVRSPYDQSLIEELPYTNWDQINSEVAEAARHFADRSQWLPAWRRMEILESLAHLVERESEVFARLIAQEGGKPITDARVEVGRAIQGIHFAATAIADVMRGSEVPTGLTKAADGRRMHTIREPIGIVFAISAFNHPLNLIVHQIVPAIAVGCPVFIKPASATPLTCLKLMDLIYKAGVPKAWCRPLLCTHEDSERLCADPRIVFVSYIGAADIGWKLRGKLAPGTRCALEHGGNAPVILLPYADHNTAIPALLKGGMSHAGQVCVSVQRVYVPWAEAGVFARSLGEAAENIKVGNPLNETTEVGPLIRPDAVKRVHQWVQEAVMEGAKLMSGGDSISESMYQPTILLDPSAHSKVTTHEIFGPVICVYGYDELDEAIERANNSSYAFQAAIWGREHDQLMHAAERLDASTVLINDHTAFRVDWMPFGGRRQSGLGTSGIPYTMRDYTQEKLVVLRV
jgi:acyl-CoA reductase-like NAD-dependent aldehyde dehydrogenase